MFGFPEASWDILEWAVFFLFVSSESGSLNYTLVLSFKINSVYYCLLDATWSIVEQYSEIAKNHRFELLNDSFSQKIQGCQRPHKVLILR